MSCPVASHHGLPRAAPFIAESHPFPLDAGLSSAANTPPTWLVPLPENLNSPARRQSNTSSHPGLHLDVGGGGGGGGDGGAWHPFQDIWQLMSAAAADIARPVDARTLRWAWAIPGVGAEPSAATSMDAFAHWRWLAGYASRLGSATAVCPPPCVMCTVLLCLHRHDALCK